MVDHGSFDLRFHEQRLKDWVQAWTTGLSELRKQEGGSDLLSGGVRVVEKEEATKAKLSYDKVARMGRSLPSSSSSDHSIAQSAQLCGVLVRDFGACLLGAGDELLEP